MNKNNRNYLVDVLIGAAFLLTALSALVFLVPTAWIDFSITTVPTVLGVNFGVWQMLHKWAGIVMMLGVVLHFVLHWQWVVTMTKKILPKHKVPESKVEIVS